jgi:hypothetical protein
MKMHFCPKSALAIIPDSPPSGEAANVGHVAVSPYDVTPLQPPDFPQNLSLKPLYSILSFDQV